MKFNENASIRSTVRRKVLNDPQKELQSIISHLEEENKQLQLELLEICGSRAERLHRHRATIESQLQRLKILKVIRLFVFISAFEYKILFKIPNIETFFPRNIYLLREDNSHRA